MVLDGKYLTSARTHAAHQGASLPQTAREKILRVISVCKFISIFMSCSVVCLAKMARRSAEPGDFLRQQFGALTITVSTTAPPPAEAPTNGEKKKKPKKKKDQNGKDKPKKKNGKGNGSSGNAAALAVAVLLCLLQPVDAQASHDCEINGTWYVTNACRTDEIYFFDGNMIVHSAGCIPCYNHTCTTPYYMSVSYLNASGEFEFCKYVDYAALGAYACDTFGLGELCSAILGTAELIHRYKHYSKLFTCDCVCAYDNAPGNMHAAFWQSLGDKFSIISDVIEYLGKIPTGFLTIIKGNYPVVVMVAVLKAMAGNWVMALMYILMAGYCSAGMHDGPYKIPLPRYDRNLKFHLAYNDTNCTHIATVKGIWSSDNWNKKPFPCFWGGWEQNVYFTSPNEHHQHTGIPECTNGVYWKYSPFMDVLKHNYSYYCGSYTLMTRGIGLRNLTFYGQPSQICVFVTKDVRKNVSREYGIFAACFVDHRKPFCGDCYWDCQREDPRKTYENCGVGWMINENMTWAWGNKTGKVMTKAVINNYAHDIECLEPFNKTKFKYPLKMPGRPNIVNGRAYPCYGFAWPTGAIGSGLVTLDCDHMKDTCVQYFVSHHFLYHIHWLSHFLILIIVASMTGGRIMPIVWALITMHIIEVNGAVNFAVPTALVVNGILSYQSIASFIYAIIVAWLCHDYRIAPYAIALAKVALGYPVLAITSIIFTYFLNGHSVGGASIQVCFDVHVPDDWIFHIDVDLAFLVCGALGVFWFYGMTRPGRLLKLRILGYVTFYHEKCYHYLNDSYIGNGRGFDYCIFTITFLIVFFFPVASTITIVLFYTSTLLIDLCWLSAVYYAKQSVKLQGMIRFCEIIADGGDYFGTRLSFKYADKLCLPPVFNHMGHLSRKAASKLRKLQLTLEPVGYEQKVEQVQDEARLLACGDYVRGKPVFGRIKDMVFIGRTRKIGKVKLTAPLSVVRVRSTAMPKAVAFGIVGKDYCDHKGSIFGLSTGLTNFMGFVLGSNLVTVQHGARSRPLATRVGSTPGWFNSNDDIATYPAPGGTTPLCKCNCITHKAYMFIRTGECMELTKSGDSWTPALVRPVKWYKGSSGTPILCPEGHVIQMFVGVGSKRLGAVKVVGKDVEIKNVTYSQPTAESEIPQVPTNQEILTFVAPTGFGKSTKVPMDYASKGNNVLVCCPSVAAVTRLVAFMKEHHRVDCNLHAGDIDIECGGRITYMTYGKMLTNLTRLDDYDVILLDECHATDSTSVLGIGSVLVRSANLKAKLILLMTATPPGSPVVPHKNINEEVLGTSGDIDFYGKKINSEWFKQGRHLIVCATKKECHRVAHELASKAIKTHVYYRGLDSAQIPAGQCVVVATDAITTGYNGDFDTVTDCSVMVEEVASVDLAPTITISRRIVPAPNALRMQRRGRCGRGRAGLYRFCDSLSSFGGCIEYATICEVYDTGICWYNFDPVFISSCLKSYNDQFGLPNLIGNYSDISAFYTVLKSYVTLPEVSVARQEGFSFALLTGVQAWLCREFKAGPPNDSARWNVFKLKGESPIPLVANIDDVCTKTTQSSDVTKKLLDALGVEIACTGLTILGVGLAVICAVQVIEAASCVIIKDDFELQTVSGKDIINPDLWSNLLEECSSMPMIQNYCQIALTHAQTFCGRLCLYFKTPTTSQKALEYLSQYSPHIGGLVSLFFSVVLGKRNPVLTSILAGTGTFLTPAPLWIKLLLGVIGSGMLAMRDAPMASSAMLMGSVAGALVSQTSMGAMIFGAAVTANASVAACDVTFSILTGHMPPTYRWFDLISAIGSPGGAIVGVVMGFVLKVATKKGLTQWTNRLLAMGTKGNTCPDFFLQIGKEEETILNLLHSMSFSRALIKFSNDFSSDFTQCNSVLSDAAVAIWNKLLMYARTLFERGRDFIPSLKFGCDKAISTKFEGTGMITTQCRCGNKIHYIVEDGHVSKNYTSWFCRNSWSSGVLLNETTTVQNVKVHQPQGALAYRYGLTDFVEVCCINGVLSLTRSTTLNINSTQLRFAMTTKPVAISDCNWFYRKVDNYLPGSSIYIDGKQVELPFCVRNQHFDVHPVEGTEKVAVVSIDGCDNGQLLEYFEHNDQYSYSCYLNFPFFRDTPEVVALLEQLHANSREAHVLIAACPKDDYTVAKLIGEIEIACNPKSVSVINYSDEEMEPIMGIPVYLPPAKAGGLIRIMMSSKSVSFSPKCSAHNAPDCEECDIDRSSRVSLGSNSLAWDGYDANLPLAEPEEASSEDDTSSESESSISTHSSMPSLESLDEVVVQASDRPSHKAAATELARNSGDSVDEYDLEMDPIDDCWDEYVDASDMPAPPRRTDLRPKVTKCSAHNDPECEVCNKTPAVDNSVTQITNLAYDPHACDSPVSHSSTSTKSEEDLACQAAAELNDIPPLPSDASSLEEIELEGNTHCIDETIEMYHQCSKPFVWTGAAVSTKKRIQRFAVSLFGMMGKNRNNVYWTDPTSTRPMIERYHHPPPREYQEVVKAMINKVSTMRCRKLTLSEVAVLTKKSAASNVSGITYKDVKVMNKKAKTAIQKAEEFFLTGKGDERLGACTIIPKSEIFGRDPDKMTEKAARHVVFAPLETRVMEKIYLGDVCGRVIKHVLGQSYGAQYTPHERAALMHKWWTSFVNPVGFTCDAISFDQQITSEDMDVEMAVICGTRMSQEQRTMIHALYSKLYKSSLLYNDRGIIVGRRYCRGSGTYVTSMNNIIAWSKLYTACKKAGLKHFKLLVNGDDCCCMFESEFKDKEQVREVENTLKLLNFQTKPIEPQYSLDKLEVCSSNVTLAITHDNRQIPLLTRNPLHPMAKAMAESNRDNPISKWVGNVIMYAGCYWARWLIVGLLDYWSRNTENTCEAELFGNTYQLRYDQICPIIKHINPEAFNIKNYTMPEISRSWRYLSHLGYETHRELTRRAVRLRMRIIRRNPEMHCLLPLLNFCVKQRMEVKTSLNIIDFSRPYEQVHYDTTLEARSNMGDVIAAAVVAVLGVLILTFI